MRCKKCSGIMRSPHGISKNTQTCGHCRGIKHCPKIKQGKRQGSQPPEGYDKIIRYGLF